MTTTGQGGRVDELQHSRDDSDRRYTDQEVALLLQRAAEIESRRSDAVPGRGLTLRELRDIARDVGISAEVFDEAVIAVQAGAKPARRALLGAPLTYKAARGVDGQLDEAAMERLIRVLEEAMDQSGTVTDALGTVRWTSLTPDQRFDPTTQVSLLTKKGETQILVVRRHPDMMRVFLHVMPSLGSGALCLAIARGAFHASDSALVIGFAVFALIGAGIGHSIWQAIGESSARKVQEVAERLASAARDLAEGQTEAR
jgi:hypothetical protein